MLQATFKEWIRNGYNKYIRPRLELAIILTIIGLIMASILFFKQYRVTASLKDSVFSEILNARNKLDLALIYFNQDGPVKTIPLFTLNHKEKVPEIFINNQNLKAGLEEVYTALYGAKVIVEKLNVLITDNRLSEIIALRKNDIVRAIKLADKVGPILAEEVNRVWRIPPKGLSDEEKIKWYNSVIIYSDASAPVGIR